MRLRWGDDKRLTGAFRQGREIIDNIFVVRRVIERGLEEGEELFLTFIGLKATFGIEYENKYLSFLLH